MTKGVNWLGVIVATILVVVIGIVWYGVVFQEKWSALAGITPEQMKSANQTASMVLGTVNSLITVLALGWLIEKLGQGSWMGGLKIGLFAGLFFAVTTAALGFIYAGHNPGLIPIDFGYLIVIYAVAGAVLGGLRLKPKAA